MNENKRTQLMSEAPVARAILKMSLPVVLGMIVQMLYNLVDIYFIGWLGDENQLAAANVTAPLFMLMMAIATIVSTGAASYISRSLGNKDNKTASETLSTGSAICIGLAVVLTVLGIIFIKPLITLLGATEAIYPFAYHYALVMILGAVPVMLNYAGGQLLRSEGAVMPSITGMMIGTVVNVILDPIFIFTFGMGVSGAAIATVIRNTAALIYYIYYYMSGKSLVKLKLKYITLKKNVWGQTFSIGVPAALSQFLLSAALIICNNLAKAYGEGFLAGMGVSAKLMYIGTFIFMGFAAGCQPLVGYNYGAKNFPRVKAIIRTGMIMTLGIGAVLTVLFGLFANGLVGIFARDMGDVVAQGSSVLRIQMFSFLVLGPQMLASTSIQAFGKAKESLVLSIGRQGLFYIPLLFLLNSRFGFLGMIWAQPVADAVTLLLAMILLAVILRKCMNTVSPQLSGQSRNIQKESLPLAEDMEAAAGQ